MGDPRPVPFIDLPDWYLGLCQRMRAAAAVAFGGTGDAPPPAPRGTAANPLTLQETQALFARLAEQAHIPFDLASAFCSARAHEMRRIMARENIECRKIFNEPTISADGQTTPPIVVRTADGRTIRWQYHVAPYVMARMPDGRLERMVIDPALFDGPVTVEEWQSVQECDAARLNDTPGSTFQPGEGRDDEYTETDRLLREARDIAEGRVPPPGPGGNGPDAPPVPPPPPFQPATPPQEEDDTIVPGPDSAEDDD